MGWRDSLRHSIGRARRFPDPCITPTQLPGLRILLAIVLMSLLLLIVVWIVYWVLLIFSTLQMLLITWVIVVLDLLRWLEGLLVALDKSLRRMVLVGAMGQLVLPARHSRALEHPGQGGGGGVQRRWRGVVVPVGLGASEAEYRGRRRSLKVHRWMIGPPFPKSSLVALTGLDRCVCFLLVVRRLMDTWVIDWL